MSIRAALRVVALGLMFVASRNETADWAAPGRYAAWAYLAFDKGLTLWLGVRRRRPHWTRQSWRRFLLACAIPVGALAVVAGMLFALDYKLPIVGAPRSPLRMMWAVGTVGFLILGAVQLSMVVGWLHDGEPSHQLRWSARRFWRREPSA